MINLGRCLLFLGVLVWGPVAASRAEGLIRNPTFQDADGDGKPEGWELDTFLVDRHRRGPEQGRVSNLSLKVPREKEYPVEGTATTTFQGPEGWYTIVVKYLDETDGISKARVLVNDEEAAYWKFDSIFRTRRRTKRIPGVRLKDGDRITIWGRDDHTEYCRVISLDVEPGEPPAEGTGVDISEIVEREYSGDLVALRDHVRFADRTGSVPSSYERPVGVPRGNQVWLVYARAGEPLVFKVTSADRRRDAKFAYSVLRLGGESDLAKGELSLKPGCSELVKAELPEPGVYRIELGRCHVDFFGRPAVLEVPPRKGVWGKNWQGYFFVPAGTRAFAVTYRALGGRTSELTVKDGAGKIRFQGILPPGEPALVRVPEGSDGAAWYLRGRGNTPTLMLRGVPPYLAGLPENLLVPKECLPSARRVR